MIRFTLICIFMGAMFSFGQQTPQYSQYVKNQYMINPGATGVYDYIGITLGGRMQWTGFENAPKTSYLYFSAPANKMRVARMKRTFGKVKRNNKQVRHPRMRVGTLTHAYGAQLLVDQYGPFRTLKAMGTYAIHLPLSRDYSLSFGTNLGVSSRRFLPDKAQVLSVMTNTGYTDQTYSAYTGNQAAQYTMDLEAGIYFHGKGIFAGISANQLTGDLVKFGNRTVNFDPRRHYFLTGGYKIQVNNKMTITPALLLKYVTPAPVTVEGTVQVEFRERFWFGATYRHKDALVAMFGAVISEKFKIGYSYDLSISKMIGYNSGGHELVLGLMLGDSGYNATKFR